MQMQRDECDLQPSLVEWTSIYVLLSIQHLASTLGALLLPHVLPSSSICPHFPFFYLYHLSLVFCRAAFFTERAHGRNIRFEALFLGRIGPRGELDERVQRNFHPGRFLLRNIHIVRVNASQHSLVSDNQNILTPLELHDDGFETDDHVAVTLAATIPIVVLVIIPRFEVLRIPIRDLLVRQAVAYSGIKLVQSLPFELVKSRGWRG